VRALMEQMQLQSAHMVHKAAGRLEKLLDYDEEFCMALRPQRITSVWLQPIFDDPCFVSLLLRYMSAKASDFNDAPTEAVLAALRIDCITIVSFLTYFEKVAQLDVLESRGASMAIIQLLLPGTIGEAEGLYELQYALAYLAKHSAAAHCNVTKDAHFVVVERAIARCTPDAVDADRILRDIRLVYGVSCRSTGAKAARFLPLADLRHRWLEQPYLLEQSHHAWLGVSMLFEIAANMLKYDDAGAADIPDPPASSVVANVFGNTESGTERQVIHLLTLSQHPDLSARQCMRIRLAVHKWLCEADLYRHDNYTSVFFSYDIVGCLFRSIICAPAQAGEHLRTLCHLLCGDAPIFRAMYYLRADRDWHIVKNLYAAQGRVGSASEIACLNRLKACE
jgi:hypothetical protein